VLLWGDTGGCVMSLATRQCTVVLPPVPAGQPPTGMPNPQLRSMYPYTAATCLLPLLYESGYKHELIMFGGTVRQACHG
jgi:hypothetical protein